MKDLEDTAVYIEIDPSDVNYINRIIEGYEYLGILTTLDPKRATCRINSTADTRAHCQKNKKDSKKARFPKRNLAFRMERGEKRQSAKVRLKI